MGILILIVFFILGFLPWELSAGISCCTSSVFSVFISRVRILLMITGTFSAPEIDVLDFLRQFVTERC